MRRGVLPYAAVALALASAPARGQDALASPVSIEELPAPSPVAADLSLAEYGERLQAVARALRAENLDEARSLAKALRAAQVTWQSETLATDSGLLDAVGHAAPATARYLAARLERLASALAAAPSGAAVPVKRDVLARVTRGDDLTAGGQVDPQVPQAPSGLLEHLGRPIQRALDWLGKVWDRFAKWLERFLPRAPKVDPSGGHGSLTTAAVFVGVGLTVILLVVLAVHALRRPQDVPTEAADLRSSSERDADPLSRKANEWEAYAQELAEAGRRREAIRAWYHAVLVALFRTGLLHYTKGCTNWEYVAALAPELRWRPSFIDLTRGFDVEWYGHDASTAQALAAYARQGRTVLRAVEVGEGHA